MGTALHTPSVAHRLGTLAIAGLLAAGLVLPQSPGALADGPQGAPGNASGLEIVIQSVDQLDGLSAVAIGDDQGVAVHAVPDAASAQLGTIPSGSEVDLRIDMVDTVLAADGTRWWPVRWDGEDGWVSGYFLTQASTPEGEVVSTTLVPYDHTRQADAHSTAQVHGNGEHVNVRAEPSLASTVVTKAADGQVISLRIDMVDTVYDDQGTRWWPVTVNGIDGWISGFHLRDSNDAPTTAPGEAPTLPQRAADPPPTQAAGPQAPEAPEAPDAPGGFAAGDFAQVFTGDGTSVNVRNNASVDAEVIGSLADGQVVEILSGPVPSDASTAGWYQVTAGSLTGYVDGDFLVRSVEAPSPDAPTPTEPPLSEEEEATQQSARPTQAPTTEPATAPTQAPATQAPQEEESSTGFIYPLAGYTRTQGFGCSNLGFYSYNQEYGCALHNGLDLAAPSGTTLRASAAGTVVTAGWCNCGLGYYVEIDHGNGVHTLYGHMRGQPSVSAGQQVSQGQAIGEVGSTGISTGPHVHFMVTVNGVARNPENYLP